MRGLPRTRVSLPATYPRKRGPRAWHTGVRQTAQRLGDRGRTSSRATQRHQPLARRTSLRPPVGTSARRGRTAQCGRQLALPAGLVGENRHGEGRPPRRGRPLEGPQRAPRGGGGPRPESLCATRYQDVAPKCPPQKASFSPLSCTRGSQRTNAHRTFEDIKVGCALRPSRRLSSVAARRASPLDSALRVDLETTLGHRQLHPDASHMRRVSPPRVSLYSMLGCELKKARSAPAASSTHAVLVPLGWPEDDSQCKIGKTSRGAV